MFAPAFHLNKQGLAWAQVSGLSCGSPSGVNDG